MNIDIYLIVVERYVDDGHRIATLFEKAVIRLLKRVAEHATLHPAAIDEEAHVAAVCPAERGLAYQAIYTRPFQVFVISADSQHVFSNVQAVDRGNCLAQAAGARGLQRCVARVQAEAHLWIG